MSLQCRCACPGALPNVGSGTFLPLKLVEQCPGLPQNGCIEALSKPAVGRGEEITGGIALSLLAPQPGETGRGAQQLPPDPMQLGLGPPLTSRSASARWTIPQSSSFALPSA